MSNLDSASAFPLSVVLTHFAAILTFCMSPSSVMILSKIIQCLQLEVVELIIATTDSLSQNKVILLFLNSLIQLSTATAMAKSSKNSMLGVHFFMNA